MADIVIAEGSKTVSGSSGDSLFVPIGSQIIDTATDQSALANGYVKVEIGNPFSGDMGTSGNPFYSEITSYLWYGAATGTMWFRCKTAGDSTPTAYAAGGGHLRCVTGGVITNFSIASGQVTVAGPFTGTNFYIVGGVTIIEDDTSTDPTILHMMAPKSGRGGRVLTERGGGTITNSAGDLTIEATANTITTLNCLGTPDTATTLIKTCGTITTANLTGHIPSGPHAYPVAITTANINMMLPGAAAFLLNPLLTIGTTNKVGSDGRNM